MTTPGTTSKHSLRVTRVIPGPREAVFRALTQPEEIVKWWAPDGYKEPTAEIDLRVGGRYRLGMIPPEGERFYAYGTYRDVKPPEKLVFTWAWENTQMDPGETLVTIEFQERESSTEVTITHQGFVSDDEQQKHADGWTSCLDRIGKIKS